MICIFIMLVMNMTLLKNIYIDKDGKYIDVFSKNQFYEAMRRMIIYGPSDWDYNDKAPDYRDIVGEFRLKEVSITDSLDADIDITFTQKTNSITYSTDMAIQDRMETIKKVFLKNINMYLQIYC